MIVNIVTGGNFDALTGSDEPIEIWRELYDLDESETSSSPQQIPTNPTAGPSINQIEGGLDHEVDQEVED